MTDGRPKYLNKYLGGFLIILLLFSFTYFLSDVVMVFALAVLLSLILHPMVSFVERKGLPRLWATVLVFTVVILSIYSGFRYLLPILYDQISQFSEGLKNFSLHKEITAIDTELRKYLPTFPKGTIAKRIEETITSQVLGFMGRLTDILSSLITVAAVVVIVPFISFFALKDSHKLIKGVLSIIPNKYFEMGYWIIKVIFLQMGKFVRAWIFDATFVGVSCGVGFWIIGIPNALPLGLIAGCGHLVPYFGPVIGGIPALIISFVTNGNVSQFPQIFILIVIIYIIDNGFVQPTVFSKNLDIHPIIIMLLIIAGSQIAGLPGMLFAIPTATVVKTLVKEIYFAFKKYKIART
ncbi:MAG: AI-2E family transporter [Bacteroidota bacterium]|nr:AI-2E family transporter [Bacteroidota bacterium]